MNSGEIREIIIIADEMIKDIKIMSKELELKIQELSKSKNTDKYKKNKKITKREAKKRKALGKMFNVIMEDLEDLGMVRAD